MKDYIFINGNIEALKKDCHGSKKDLYVRLIEHCESYFSIDLPDEHPPASTTFMGIAMANLSLAYLLSRDSRYLYEAKRWIFSCTSYPHWGNAHLVDVDLSAAWILFGMGISYAWLKDEFKQAEAKLVKEKILLQGSRMYSFKIESAGSGWSTNYWQNHNWINMTGLAAAAYALIDEDSSVQPWIDEAKSNFKIVYDVMPEDGSDYEGVVYWRYGAMWLFIYAHLLKEREGIDYFRTCPFLKNTFYYRLYQAAPNLEEQINFGDAHDRRSGHSTAIYYKVASEYGNGHAQKLANLVRTEFLEREAKLSKVKPGILPECFFELLFYDDSVQEEDFNNLPLTAYFEDLGLFASRSSWNRDASLISFKCSHPGGKKQWKLLWEYKKKKNYDCFGLSHQHPDNNSFLLHSGGKFFAIDDGYNRNVKASDHNVVLVDGQGYHEEGQNNIWKNYSQNMFGEVEECRIENHFSYIRGETAAVYRKDLELKSYKRHLVVNRRSWYFIIDEMDSPLEHHYTWQMYSDVHPQVKDNLYSYSIGDAELSLYHYASVPTRYELKDNVVRAVMTTQEPDKFTENHMKGLAFSNYEKVRTMSFLTLLLPGEKPFESFDVQRLDTEGAYGICIQDKVTGESEVLLYSELGQFHYMEREFTSKIALFSHKSSGDYSYESLC